MVSELISFYPDQMEICLSERCNFECDYCFMNKSCSENLSFEGAAKGVEHFLSSGRKIVTITFNSGEPLINFKILKKVIGYIFSRSEELNIQARIVVTTNCLLLNRKIFDYFSKDKRLMLNISLDGMKDFHDKHRKIKGRERVSSFDMIWNNISNITKEGIRVISTVTPENISHISDNLEFLMRNGFRKFDIFPQMFTVYNKGQLEIFKEQIDHVNSIILKEKFNGTDTDIFLTNRVWGRTCYNKILLGSDGRFYLFDAITILPYEKRENYAIGDIHRGINYRKRVELFNSIIKDVNGSANYKCSSCKLYGMCLLPIPLYLWCKDRGKPFMKYLNSFCKIAEILISLNVQNKLIMNEAQNKILSGRNGCG